MGMFQHDCPYCSTSKAYFSIVDQKEKTWKSKTTAAEFAHVIAFCGGCDRGVLALFKRTGNKDHPTLLIGNVLEKYWKLISVHPSSPSIESPPHVPTNIASTLSGALKSLQQQIWPGAGMLARKPSKWL